MGKTEFKVNWKYWEGEKTGIDRTIVHIAFDKKMWTITERSLLENYERTNEYGLCFSLCDGLKVNWKYVKEDGKKTVDRKEADKIIAFVYSSGEIQIALKDSAVFINECYGHSVSGASVMESIKRGTKKGCFY